MVQSLNGMAERFRAGLATSGPIILPGCYDVLSAIVLEEAGFSCAFLSGYSVAASFFGNPDIGLTALPETAMVAKNVAAAVKIPLVVDVDNGYGNEDNVIRTVHELEHAGAAAIIMEDQIFPKRCGHAAEKKVLPLETYMHKLESVLAHRKTPMCVIARTDSMVLDDAIARTKAFHAAGADLVLIDGLDSMETLKRVANEVPGHKVLNLIYGGKTPLLPSLELHKLGFKVILYSTPALYVAAAALEQHMKALFAAQDLNSISSASVTFKHFQRLIEERYLARTKSTHDKAD